MSGAAAILLCGGSGTRMSGTVADKVLAPLAGRPVVAWSLAAFAAAGVAGTVVLVYRDSAQRGRLEALWEGRPDGLRGATVRFAQGGARRQDSVGNGLDALSDLREDTLAYVHDGARPLVLPEALHRVGKAAARNGAAALAARVTDTIRRQPEGGRPEELPREELWAMQTPQVARLGELRAALRQACEEGAALTDDLAALVRLGHAVTLVETGAPNPKLTTPEDFAVAEALLKARGEPVA